MLVFSSLKMILKDKLKSIYYEITGKIGKYQTYYNSFNLNHYTILYDNPGYVCIITYYGDKYYFFNKLKHKDDGPAVCIYNQVDMYYMEGKLHRLDGPAKIFKDGRLEWWYQDNKINVTNQRDFERIIKLKIYW